jgi:hypothetical protein
MAWSAFSLALKVRQSGFYVLYMILSEALCQAIAGQVARDTNVGELLLKMNDVYEFIRRTKTMGDLDQYRSEVMEQILLQTFDCSWFIRDYVSRGFGQFLQHMNHARITYLLEKSYVVSRPS